MKVASVLSDLTSLRVCDQSAALALVNSGSEHEGAVPTEESDPDLKRATDLMALHKGVKERYAHGGSDSVLKKAREDVARVKKEVKLSQ